MTAQAWESRPGEEAAIQKQTDVLNANTTHLYLPEDAPEHHVWDVPEDSNLDAALFWASAGFPVAPEGSTAFTCDPDAIAAAWVHVPDAQVMAQAPAGTFGIVSTLGALRAVPKGDALLRDGAPLTWNPFPPHWQDEMQGEPVADTFRVMGIVGFDVEVRLYRAPAGTQPVAHHLPDGIALLAAPIPMPCPANWPVTGLGVFHDPPAHLQLLLQPEALPCSEQDLKGYLCSSCAPYRNTRTEAELAAAAATYRELMPKGIDVHARAEEMGWA